MAAPRGLNKGRGLGALIPQKTKASVSGDAAKTERPVEESVPGEGKGGPDTEKAEKKTAAKKPVKAAAKSPAKAKAKPAAKASAKTAAKTAAGTPEKPAAKNPAKVRENKTELEDGKPAENGVAEVRLTEIVPNHEQPRKRFDEEGLQELAASIRVHGVITPLLVQKKGKFYELIAGERRWRAAGIAGLKTVPVLVREFSGQEAAEIALIENIQREDLNAIEEARAYKQLMEEHHLTQEEIAERVSKGRTTVTNSLRLLKLDESVQQMLEDGQLTMGHARALLAVEDPGVQRVTAERVVERQLSVRETERLVGQMLAPVKRRKRKEADPQLEAVYMELEDQLRRSVGTKVTIRPMQGNKGKVEIEYYSTEDLERIIDRLR